ncbi:hypothetical protein DL766_003590 [Monosporascus sp. MC13-8B]|uniref:FAD dependent oxidoreductase domain-containing protein n=1 Tax=Monosporascus cannonballus TaxID=155416 RepID=A0ABY0GRY1_9PEZI|nr:hypothetical protein DL762_009948 [Monosporascus cannonballus]RYO91829.1 hypothetical protein DL763_004882 [Monosporascus cannonballus]RYP33210.1 hypothetical protein DL766_003590 [Monosporascus sp. MC13-8B]
MGAVQSKLKTVCLVIKLFLEANKSLEELLKRASAAPGLPVPNPTPSYWLADPPYPELVDIRSPQLPAEADVVIIGSGITGAAVARSVLSVLSERRRRDATITANAPHPDPNPEQNIVVLEARTLCSGATGRNGGHIKPSPYEAFAQQRRASLSPERAAELARFQVVHVRTLTELCAREGWDALAECREVETVDLYLDEGDRDAAFVEVRELGRWAPELEMHMWDAAEAREGAISYKAGALWPFRFVSCVWKDLLTKYEKRLSLETGTSVLSIGSRRGDGYAYEATTNRGVVKCNHVVHATNGFAAQFISGLRGKMTGALGTMSAQRPGDKFPDLNGASVVGVWDDSRTEALPLAHLGGIFPTIFEPNWGRDSSPEGEGSRTKQAWSGVVCATGDLLPFVGRLDPRLTGRPEGAGAKAQVNAESSGCAVQPGEWISAGYSGDGMVWAWLSGTALGIMISGGETEDLSEAPGRPGGRLSDWFPPELLPSLSRVKKAGLENFVERFS